MNSPSAVRAKIYAFLHQKFGIERVKYEAELQELKKLLVELQESANPVRFDKHAGANAGIPKEIKEKLKEESKFFTPKSFG